MAEKPQRRVPVSAEARTVVLNNRGEVMGVQLFNAETFHKAKGLSDDYVFPSKFLVAFTHVQFMPNMVPQYMMDAPTAMQNYFSTGRFQLHVNNSIDGAEADKVRDFVQLTIRDAVHAGFGDVENIKNGQGVHILGDTYRYYYGSITQKHVLKKWDSDEEAFADKHLDTLIKAVRAHYLQGLLD